MCLLNDSLDLAQYYNPPSPFPPVPPSLPHHGVDRNTFQLCEWKLHGCLISVYLKLATDSYVAVECKEEKQHVLDYAVFELFSSMLDINIKLYWANVQ